MKGLVHNIVIDQTKSILLLSAVVCKYFLSRKSMTVLCLTTCENVLNTHLTERVFISSFSINIAVQRVTVHDTKMMSNNFNTFT